MGEYAFANCKCLTSVEIEKGLKIIKENTFYGCDSLTEVILPETIEKIEEGVFSGCFLEKIIMSSNIKEIGRSLFTAPPQKTELITPWGTTIIERSSYREIVLNYLYLYANFILKDKYNSIDEFLSNSSIKEMDYWINEEMAIYKFKKLFYKMRKEYNIPSDLFCYLSEEQAEKFDFNTWKDILSVFYPKITDDNETEMYSALSEMIEIFGLFETDSKKNERVEKFKEFITNVILTNKELKSLTKESDEECFISSNKAIYTTKRKYYDIDGEELEYIEFIPEEFRVYLNRSILSEEIVKKVRQLSGSYGKRINDFIKETYKKEESLEYKLKEKYYDNEYFNNIIFNEKLIGHVNYDSIHRIFDGCKKEFNQDFYEFFIDNLIFILSNEEIQSNIKNIQEDFEAIKNHYKYTSGTQKVTLKQAVDYLENKTFNYHDGNYELSQDVKKAGISSQETFDYYQEVFEKNDVRNLSSLVKRSNIYEIDGYTIKAELLRKDDSFAMLVGEINYTNCCQVFGGVGHNCMAHAVSSDDGGIFVTRILKDGEWILLTESWDWQNNNVYCHDNIEATSYLKNNSRLKQAVAEVYRLDAEYIIKKSKEEVEKYIKDKKKIIEKSLSINKEKELEELRELEQREVIRVVTTGNGNDDLGLSNYFSTSINVNENQFINGKKYTLENFQPVNYNSTQTYFDKEKTAYTDSKNTQYIIAGSIEDLCIEKLQPLVPIYRDERRIILEKDEQVRNYTIKKIKDIEKKIYSNNMQQYQKASKETFKNENIYLGEDWYLVYEELDENTIYISDLTKTNPSLIDENGIQNQEIMHVVYDLIKKYDIVKADLKEDTSYLLFLINKKLGYLEQIGEDIAYSFDNRSETKVITIEEQENILKNAKKIKEAKNQDQIMHSITFKKGRRLEEQSKILK